MKGIFLKFLIVNFTREISHDEAADAEAKGRNYIHRGVAKRSFNLGYKIASKFSLANAAAEMENGLLTIEIPFAEEAKPKVLKIK